MRKLLLHLLMSAMACMILGCTVSNKGARVIEGPRPQSYEYRVKAGDTLYSIAWRHEMNHMELARINNIAHPYTIYPDQKLKVSNPPLVSETPREVSQPKRQASTPVVTPVTVPEPTTTAQQQSARAAKENGDRAAPTARPARRSAIAGWTWPSSENVSKSFGPNNKGVNFKLKAGSEIRAAGNGTVVYAGGGLGGYRSLVIIRHNEQYLSAYSIDQGVLVGEGQQVRSGEVIARVAGTPGRDMHFEVRVAGKPIDPMRVLRSKS